MGWLTPRLGDFYRAHPDVGLRVDEDGTPLQAAEMLRPPGAAQHRPRHALAYSAPGEDGSKPCSISQRAASRLRNDHHARITSRSTSVP